ncbi:MAG: sugar phosphate isomerase/epimerase family protein [Candidatus Thorarchaeota archaeon]
MKIGASLLLNFQGNESILDFFRIANKKELDVIEIVAEPPFCYIDDLRQDDRKKIKKLAKDQNQIITIHATFSDINIASINDNVRNFAVNEIKKCLDLALELEAKIVTFHPGDFGAVGVSYPLQASEMNFSSVSQLEKYARSLDIKIGYENMPQLMKNQLIDSFDIIKIKEIVQQFNSCFLGITWDVGHSHTKEFSLKESFSAFKEKLLHIHIHDNDGPMNSWSDTHLELGKGTIDWKEFFKLTKNIDVTSVFELNSWEKIDNSLEYINSL